MSSPGSQPGFHLLPPSAFDQSRTRMIGVAAACIALSGVVFVLDLLTPLGLPAWFLYFIPVLLSLWTRRPAIPIVLAGLCSVFIGLGLYLSPTGIPFAHALVIRLFGIALVWTVALGAMAPRIANPSPEEPAPSMDRRTVASLIGAGLMVVFLMVVSYLGMTTYQESERLVAHTQEVLIKLSQTRTSVMDAEAGQRGFLLTGQALYLEIYTQASAQIAGHLGALKDLMHGTAVEPRLSDLDALVEEKLSELHETILVRQSQGPDAARGIVMSERGKQAMNRIRSTIAQMEDTERERLAQRVRASEINYQSLGLFLVLGWLGLVGLLVTVTLFCRQQQAAQRMRAAILQAARLHAETIIETVREPLIVLTADLRIQRANYAFYQTFHLTREEIDNRLFYEWGNGQWNIPKLIESLRRMIPEHTEFSDFEVTHEFPGTAPRMMLLSARKLYRPGNNTEHILLAIEDITERKRAEAALRKAAEEIRDLYDKAPCGYHSLDKDGVFLDVNQTELEWLGYTRDELVGKKKFLDVITPESVSRFQTQFPVFKQRGWVRELEFDLVRKDGTILPVLLNATAVKDAQGQYLSSRSTLFDITERKAVENEVQSTQAFLDSIVENIPNMLFVKDARDLKFLRFNKAGEQLLGYRRQDLIGKSDYDLFSKEKADFFTSKDRVVLDSKQLLNIPEEAIDTPHLGTRILHTSKIPILDKEGRPRYLLGISEDITERKRAEAERDRFFTLSLDMLCIAHKDGYFKRVSPAFTHTLGWSTAELLARPFIEFVHPDDRQATLREVERLIIAGEPVLQFENRYEHKDGSWRVLSWKSAAAQPDGFMYAVARDVTELKQAEEALRGSEERFRLMARATNDVLWDWNLVTDSVWWGATVAAVFGYGHGDLEPDSESWSSRIHPEDHERILAEIQDAMARRKSAWSGEYRFRRADGSYAEVFDRAFLLFNESGVPVRIVGAMQDCTERRRGEKAERYLAAIVEFSEDAIIGKDLESVIESWNRGAEKLFGYHAGEMVGQPATRLIPPDRLYEEAQILDRIRQGDNVESFETVRLRKGGASLEVSVTVSPIRDSAERIIGASTIVRNITERKRAEEAMREVLATLDATTDGTFIFDPQSLRFTYVNDGAVQQVGYSRQELLTMTPLDINPEFNEPEFRAMIAPLANGQRRVHTFATVHRRKDGVDVPVEINLQSVAVGTAQVRLIAIVRDITERKQAEEALQRAHVELERRVEERTQDLVKKTRDLETLLYVTSHDLREPLRSIENFSRLVQERYADRLDDKGRDFLRRVVRGAQRMDQLMADLLALSRVQRMELSSEEVEGEWLAAEAMRRLEDKIKETGATVRVISPLPRFRANSTWATQGIYNLLANALKFRVPAGAPPDIEIAAYRSKGPKGEAVGLVVRDRGPGVPPKHAERIFQLFQRAVGREVEGTGAGLAIVRQVAERHGGRAWVQARDGGGSEFFLTFGPEPEINRRV